MTSPANPHIKLIRKLREPKERKQSGLFYIEGLRIVAEAFLTGAKVEYLVIAPDLLTSDYANQLIRNEPAASLPRFELTPEAFSSFSLKDRPQGLGAVVHQNWSTLGNLSEKPGLWVALDSVQDPGNLGTILRTADAVGCQGLVLLDQSTDPYDPTAVRASMGAIFSQKIIKTTIHDFTSWKETSELPVVGTSGVADLDYHQVHYPFPFILLMGSEKQGLLKQHLSLCDMIVKIPMVGRSDSLNLAVATAVVLYEVFNQQR
jgi:RNA methyltransferase, TrmH family